MTKETKKSIRDILILYSLILYSLLIRYSIAFLPIFSGGLLLIFGDAFDLCSQQMVVVLSVPVTASQMVFGLSVLVTASLVVYNYQADDQNPDNPNPDHLYKTKPRFVDQALIVSLWVFGAIGVLFRGWELHLEIYFQTITALAVMYVLLVAFRIDRLVRRTAEEEELTLDLMGKALYWQTIYRSEVEATIARWKDIGDEKVGNLRTKIEEILIEKKDNYGLSDTNKKPSDIMEDENIAEEIVTALAKEALVKELQLKDLQLKDLQLKDLQLKDFPKENVEAAIEPQRKRFRRLINDKCAKNLLAGSVMTEVMEHIDKGKPEKELIDAYRTAMKYIDALEEWEIEKVNRPARDIQMAKFEMQDMEEAKHVMLKAEAKIRDILEMMEAAKLAMRKMEEDKPPGWEIERAKLKKQVQEWEIERAKRKELVKKWEEENPELKERVQKWEIEKANFERQMQEWEEEKDNHQEKTDERIVKLKEFQTDFTKFIDSRQQGSNPSELIAIGAIGFALVVLMLLGFPGIPPEETGGIERITGFGAFSVHLFTLFTSTIVVFLFFRILDLENDRYRSLHDVVPGYFGSEYEYSKLWKQVFHRSYERPSGIWIYPIPVVTAIVYVLWWWDKLVPH